MRTQHQTLQSAQHETLRHIKWPCPRCLGRTRVYDSVGAERWRECLTCGVRFMTVETLTRFVNMYRKKKATSTHGQATL